VVEDRKRDTSSSPYPLSADYHIIYPEFIKDDAEEVTWDFHILKIVQAVFYAIVVNDAIKLGVLQWIVTRAGTHL